LVTLSGTPSIQERNPFYLNLLFYLLTVLTVPWQVQQPQLVST